MASGPFTLAQLAKIVGMDIEDVRHCLQSRLLPPARRRKGRGGDTGFYSEHVERLKFIQRALICGYTADDIAGFIDPAALVTCGDVYRVTTRRLEALRQSGSGDTLAAAHLARLAAECSHVGSRYDCTILRELARPDC